MFIDVVIPVDVKDRQKLLVSLPSILSNCTTPIRYIYLIASRHFDFINMPKVKIFLEEKFPFTLQDVDGILKDAGSSHPHTTWYYQQLLKLCVFEVIDDLCDNVLVLDSDFAIKRPIGFLTDEGHAILSRGYPFRWTVGGVREVDVEPKHPHIDHSKRLVPGWKLVDNFLGMHHHILLRKEIMETLFDEVQQHHRLPFWMAFMKSVEVAKWNAASEYMLYYHYCLLKFPHKTVARHLKTFNIVHDSRENTDEAMFKWKNMIGDVACDAVGCHGFVDLRRRWRTSEYMDEESRRIVDTKHGDGFILKLMEGQVELEPLFESLNQ